MFLESTHVPQSEQVISDVGIVDVGVLIAHIGDRPYLQTGSLEHLTALDIQLIAYFSQGLHIARTGRSLFSEDFYVDGGYIKNPKLESIFGKPNTCVTPFDMTEEIRRQLTPPIRGFDAFNNKLVADTAMVLLPKGRKELMKIIRESEPFTNAMKREFHIISKKDIKAFFDAQFVKQDHLDKTWSIEDKPIFTVED